MALLKRQDVLGKVDVAVRDVEVPEWGGSVRVRSMTVAERGEFVKRAAADSDAGAWLVSLLCVDEAGDRLFTAEDVAAIQTKNFRAVDAVISSILEVNGLKEQAVEAALGNS